MMTGRERIQQFIKDTERFVHSCVTDSNKARYLNLAFNMQLLLDVCNAFDNFHQHWGDETSWDEYNKIGAALDRLDKEAV